MKNVYIGIDPAFRKNGFTIAIIDEENTISFKAFKNGFYDFLGWLVNDAPQNAVFGIENSNLQKKIFVQTMHYAESVGKNKVASQYTVDACSLYFSNSTYEFSPKQKGKKLDHVETVRIIDSNNWILEKKRTNQDQRDALKLAHLARNKHRLLSRVTN